MNIKKGALVEYTDEWIQHYDDEAAQKHARFGVAIEEGQVGESVRVEGADGIVLARWIHAHSWGGWIPEELEEIWEKHNPEPLEYEDWW